MVNKVYNHLWHDLDQMSALMKEKEALKLKKRTLWVSFGKNATEVTKWMEEAQALLINKVFICLLQTVVLKVGMSCQGCVGAVKRVLGKMEGVESYEVDLEQQKVTVKGNVQPDAVLQTVSKTGKKTAFWEAEALAETEAKPAETEVQPAETEANPAETKVKPAETEAKPTEPEAKPTEAVAAA
ncbi:hypothetical protein Gorai_003992 [Gossypium raimondii]|uniref:HMA domain-containing protein n=2 Tax=Gossypium raimondii TaxID=29730 RepID=A0A7J8QHL8_GOSRA|nr:hypothetical protein [Gossypium raimondii]